MKRRTFLKILGATAASFSLTDLNFLKSAIAAPEFKEKQPYYLYRSAVKYSKPQLSKEEILNSKVMLYKKLRQSKYAPIINNRVEFIQEKCDRDNCIVIMIGYRSS